jgi:hypothetical protein
VAAFAKDVLTNGDNGLAESQQLVANSFVSSTFISGKIFITGARKYSAPPA